MFIIVFQWASLWIALAVAITATTKKRSGKESSTTAIV
jgi:hypothetical protein